MNTTPSGQPNWWGEPGLDIADRKTGPPEPEPATTIWRYMSLHVFLTLLTERRLMFHQFKKLEESDVREGMAIEGFWESMPDRADDWEEKSDRNLQILRYTWYASCWSMSEIEDALMWRGYAPRGIAIKTTVGQLKKAEQEERGRLSICGNEIVYANDWPELETQDYTHLNKIPLHVLFMHTKRKAFADEREARFRVQINTKICPALLNVSGKLDDLPKICRDEWFPVTFTKLDWIDEVVAESSIPPWAADTIRQLVEGQGLKFRQSGI